MLMPVNVGLTATGSVKQWWQVCGTTGVSYENLKILQNTVITHSMPPAMQYMGEPMPPGRREQPCPQVVQALVVYLPLPPCPHLPTTCSLHLVSIRYISGLHLLFTPSCLQFQAAGFIEGCRQWHCSTGTGTVTCSGGRSAYRSQA